MRQRLRAFFPIILIALAVQILAPIASSWAVAIASSDPLRSAAICHSDSRALPGSPDSGSDHRSQDGTCAICCLVHANASFDAPQPIAFAAPILGAASVDWQRVAPDLARTHTDANARARAPPQAI